MTTKPIIWTIGTSNRSIAEYIALLQTADIQTVIDCRTKPYSRFPHFNIHKLTEHLLRAGIQYEFHGNHLGGLGSNVLFDETLDELTKRASTGERLALTCSEGNYKKCHRYTILQPELEKRGVGIEHLCY